MVKHQVQFNCPFGATVLRPVIHRQTQIGHGRVEADKLVLETGLLFAHGFVRYDAEQAVEDFLEQLPGRCPLA